MRVDLRAERERQGLSLAQAATRCRIPQRYLEALETGQRQDLPRGPFLDAYQRQYLSFLGLPPDAELAAAGPAPAPVARPAPAPGARPASTSVPRPVAAPVAGPAAASPAAASQPRVERPRPAPPPVQAELDPPSQGDDPPSVEPDDLGQTRTITRQYDSVPVVRLVLAGFLVTMTLVLGMKVLSGIIDRATAPPAAEPDGGVTTVVVKSNEQAPATPPAEAPAAPPTAEPTPTAAPPEGETPPTGSAGAEAMEGADPFPDGVVLGEGEAGPLPGMRVNLRAHERVKVQVELDGSTVFAGWLDAGESHDFHGEERIAVDVGDLTRIAIHYDGERVDPLGNLAQPRRLVFLRGEE